MIEDPLAGRDARTRPTGEQQAFERFEPMTRRMLLAIGLITLSIGLIHQFTL